MPTSHKHGQCAPVLQTIIVLFGLLALGLSLYGYEYDTIWNEDLKQISRSFTAKENELLKREDDMYLERAFIGTMGLSTVFVFIHLLISIRSPKNDHYGNKASKIFHWILLLVHVHASGIMVVSMVIYDENYSTVEEGDVRNYTFKFISKSKEVIIPSPHSIFYYCHLGNGKLTRPAELKGIRIKKTGSKLCQHLGSKILAALFSLYIAILCYCVQWFVALGDRYIDGHTMAQLFDLYGDAEEFSRDHPTHQDPSIEVAEFRRQLKYREVDEVDLIEISLIERQSIAITTDDDDDDGPLASTSFIRRGAI